MNYFLFLTITRITSCTIGCTCRTFITFSHKTPTISYTTIITDLSKKVNKEKKNDKISFFIFIEP